MLESKMVDQLPVAKMSELCQTPPAWPQFGSAAAAFSSGNESVVFILSFLCAKCHESANQYAGATRRSHGTVEQAFRQERAPVVYRLVY